LFAIELALQNLFMTQETLLQKMHFADTEVVLLPEDTSNLPDLSAIDGVAATASRLVLPGTITLRNNDALAALVLYQDSPVPDINQIRILEGRPFKPGAHEVVIDKALAEYHHFGLGDRLQVKVGGSISTYSVSGIAMSPEFLITSANPDYVIAEPGSLGVLWADAGEVRDSVGFSMVNSLLFRFREDADPAATSGRIMEKLARVNIEKVIPKTESYSYKSVKMDLTAFGVYSPAIIVTLCMLSLAMGMITFRRFLVEKQREFGVLAALGVGRRRMIIALARAGFLIGVVGALAGLLIGWGVGWAFAEVYATAIHLPLVVHTFDIPLAVTSVAIGVASGCLSLLLPAVMMLRRHPRELLMPAPAQAGGVSALQLPSCSVMFRYSVRSLLRDRALTFCSVLAMGCSVAVAIAYGLAMTSTFGTVETSFQQERWSYAADFQYALYEDESEALLRGLQVRNSEPYFRTAADVRHGQQHAIAVLVGLQTPGRMRELRPASGRAPTNDSEAVVSSDLAHELGLTLGSKFSIQKGTVEAAVTAVGITNDIYLHTVNVSLAVTQKLAQAESKVSGVYLDAPPDSARALAARTEEVARVTDKNRLVEHFRTEIGDMMGIVYITILFSVGVSVLFVTTLVYLGIAEKRGEYAVLRSMGFTVVSLRNMILTGIAIQILLSLALAVPVSLALVRMLNERMGAAWFAVQIHTSLPDFLWPMLSALLVAPVVGLLGARAVLGLNIPSFIRGRSI
jgi:putative ABC transport system permease protein